MTSIFAGSESTRETATGLLAEAYEQHGARLVDWVFARLESGDWHLAEDLAAEVWASITANLDLVDSRVLEAGWLQIIASGVVRNHLDRDAGELAELVGFRGEENELAVDQAADFVPSALAFRRSHGDPENWSAGEYETYGHLAEADSVPSAAWVRPIDTAEGALAA